jgi:hypothetical protein
MNFLRFNEPPFSNQAFEESAENKLKGCVPAEMKCLLKGGEGPVERHRIV